MKSITARNGHIEVRMYDKIQALALLLKYLGAEKGQAEIGNFTMNIIRADSDELEPSQTVCSGPASSEASSVRTPPRTRSLATAPSVKTSSPTRPAVAQPLAAGPSMGGHVSDWIPGENLFAKTA